MGAIVNGLALTKVRAFGSGFFIFSDYMREPIRLSALMEIPTVWIFTHDSIGVGEDGPTHQPIEQLASLRAIPGLLVLRPADANEVVEAWRVIMELEARAGRPRVDARGGPHLRPGALRLGERAGAGRVRDGGSRGRPAGGAAAGHGQRSGPVHRGLRAAQERGHSGPRGQHALLGAVREAEPGVSRQRATTERLGAGGGGGGFRALAGPSTSATSGAILAMQTFGASAPLQQLLEKFGFTAEHVVTAAREQIARVRGVAEPVG